MLTYFFSTEYVFKSTNILGRKGNSKSFTGKERTVPNQFHGLGGQEKDLLPSKRRRKRSKGEEGRREQKRIVAYCHKRL